MTTTRSRLEPMAAAILATTLLTLTAAPIQAQSAPEREANPFFHTFSIVAVDPGTGETGVAVTTRVPCVGNVVPWVRAGVGAVATQAWTRVEYGQEVLDLLEEGHAAGEALSLALEGDDEAERRQLGVVAADGTTAQHSGDEMIPWAGELSGPGFAVQGNILAGREVVEAVAETFRRTEGEALHLSDRLVEALEAGQAAGGDHRRGRLQSAAVLVADPREDHAARPDGVTTDIHVCEHPEPVAELRRVLDTVSGKLGWRTLQAYRGSDVAQLKIVLHALGHYRPDEDALERDAALFEYDREAVEAVDAFRREQGLATADIGSPEGLVDGEAVERMWDALEARGLTEDVRRDLLELTRVRR